MTHNPIRPWRNIDRRRSRKIMVGSVPVGGDAPISVQTMTNTDSSDVRATLAQVIAAADAGADIVRVSTPDEASTRALREICRESPVPIVADIHFHYRRGIEAGAVEIGDAARHAGNQCCADDDRTVRRAGRERSGDDHASRRRDAGAPMSTLSGMTGFGRADGAADGWTWSVEARC